MRRTKEQIRKDNAPKRIDQLIQTLKYLREPKYHKNNYWSTAAWDSWAAQGKAGSCICGCGYYNATLSNKRSTTKRGGSKDVCKNVSPHLCYDCYTLVEKKLDTTFKRH